MNDIVASFSLYLKKTKGLKDQSVRNYRADLLHFLSWMGLNRESKDKIAILRLRELREQMLNNYKEFLLANKLAKNTINRRLATLRVFCQFSHNQGWLEQDFAAEVNNLPVNRSEDKKIQDLVSKFGSYLKKKRSSKNTIKNYTADVRQYFEFINSKHEALNSKQTSNFKCSKHLNFLRN